ncbi:alpha/beta hydrolase [Curvibacter sp. CHRR-16]|uniref:alpha/beta fold hydrolase n=1 Tax=Curvibacter sp. CHRR-16 TaxID=2835872 RepID=UPI001BD9E36F|nr:alpha/beta hydrolase [Curvibacter sp. CHRR-16]MBT0569302.1 alpha/beta hydrolase [Curvibacter sp. CHRR-16]
MADPRLNSIVCRDSANTHRMAYWEWGNPEALHAIVCVHGLTRQGRDFDVLARALVAQTQGAVRVLCPDVAGRGQSDWLANPQDYQLPVYGADLVQLVQALQLQSVSWVGTSMGGLLGMACVPALVQLGVQVPKLVLNDVGPVLEWQAMQRIGQYVGQVPVFPNLAQALAILRAVSLGFGPHTEQQWLDFSIHALKPLGQGTWTLRYDPALAQPFASTSEESVKQGEAFLWAAYDAIRADTLLLRGQESDLLSAATAQAMQARGPRARLVEFAGVGHAPTLVVPDQYQVVIDHLLAT